MGVFEKNVAHDEKANDSSFFAPRWHRLQGGDARSVTEQLRNKLAAGVLPGQIFYYTGNFPKNPAGKIDNNKLLEMVADHMVAELSDEDSGRTGTPKTKTPGSSSASPFSSRESSGSRSTDDGSPGSSADDGLSLLPRSASAKTSRSVRFPHENDLEEFTDAKLWGKKYYIYKERRPASSRLVEIEKTPQTKSDRGPPTKYRTTKNTFRSLNTSTC